MQNMKKKNFGNSNFFIIIFATRHPLRHQNERNKSHTGQITKAKIKDKYEGKGQTAKANIFPHIISYLILSHHIISNYLA